MCLQTSNKRSRSTNKIELVILDQHVNTVHVSNTSKFCVNQKGNKVKFIG